MKRVYALALVTLFAGCGAVQQSSGVEEPTPDLEELTPRELKVLRDLAEKGDATAQFFVGSLHRTGEHVPQDYAEALKWFRKAAEQGNADAQFNLGLMYSEGEGVPQDYAEAVKWYRMAAEQGNTNGQFNLGVMYVRGQGVPLRNILPAELQYDYVLAHKWWNLAASRYSSGQDAEKSRKARDTVAEKMTPAQIAEAQRLAREWKPKTWEELKVQVANRGWQ